MLAEFLRVNEIVAEPGAFLRIELLDRPIDHPTNPRYLSEIGMIAQPDIEGITPSDGEWDHRCADREIVSRQATYRYAVDDRRVKRGADIRAHRDEAGLRSFRICLIVQIARPALIGVHHDEAVAFADLLRRLPQAIGVDIGFPRARHHFHSPHSSPHYIPRPRLPHSHLPA